MTDPAVAPVVLTASGLTVLGVSTGIAPELLFTGLAGGWWALSYITEPLPLRRRLTIAAVSALAGAWGGAWAAPLLAAGASHFIGWWPAEAGGMSLRYVVALVLGLLSHRHIGPLLMRRAEALDREQQP